ncbi:DUF2628 domain-containing protein [Aquimarina macrocephali]|uniref:DUF2628 domain-containing protein n=1 Tax=Aquimarina macrocephali TaxID=666563 RepID=UPI003F66C735
MVEQKYYNFFFQKSINYYLKRLNNQFTFNIDAFFLGILWVFYRKMYKYGVLAVLIILFFLFIGYVIDYCIITSDDFFYYYNLILTICGSIAFGFLGNYFYLKHTKSKINSIIQNTSDKKSILIELKRQGGVNIVLPTIILFLILLISSILN